MPGVIAGLSYGWWTHKHNRHHGSPNQEGKDPDIASGVLAFTAAVAQAGSGTAGRFVRRQGWFFFPLLLLEGVNLHVAGAELPDRAPSVPEHAAAQRAPRSAHDRLILRRARRPVPLTGLLASYAIVVRYLNAVGLRHRDPFACPLVQQFRA
jgi:Fatty acid desaturase